MSIDIVVLGVKCKWQLKDNSSYCGTVLRREVSSDDVQINEVLKDVFAIVIHELNVQFLNKEAFIAEMAWAWSTFMRKNKELVDDILHNKRPHFPTTIDVLNTEIVWKEEDPGMWGPNGMGRVNTMKGLITTRKDMPTAILYNVLIHEVIHIMFDILGTQEADDEKIVSVLAQAIVSFIRENKDFIEWMQDVST